MIPAVILLRRRASTPVIALIKLIGICLILVEVMFIQIDGWHPWPEHGVTFNATSYGTLEWLDGSILGCAEAYHSFDSSIGEFGGSSKSWHLDVYLGRAWMANVKSFDLDTQEETISKAEQWCKQ